MDQATQQNAALVEEMAAAASCLKGQADDLVKVVSTFKLHGTAQVSAVVATSRAAAPKRMPAAAMTQRASAAPASVPTPVKAALVRPASTAKPVPAAETVAAGADDDWESF
jgi:methyl-accepting chemotaxis protein